MALWSTIGNGLSKVGQGLSTGAKTFSDTLKTSVKNVGSRLSKVPTQYQFDSLSTLGSSTIPTQYQFDNLSKPLFGDYDLGGTNGGKNTFPTTTTTKASEDFIKALTQQSNTQNSASSSGYAPSSYNYEFNPSMVDYSQFMGLSPETQRYLYGGM